MKSALLFVALFTSAVAPVAHSQSRKEIIAGPVEVADQRISGSFKVVESDRSGIESNGSGGACLVFSQSRSGSQTCRQDSDCSPDQQFAGGSAYCLHQGKAPQGRCWTRPAETPATPYCRRSPAAPLPLDQDIVFPVDAAGKLAPVVSARPGWWRVHACLNKAPGACADPANPDKMTSDGPPRKLP